MYDIDFSDPKMNIGKEFSNPNAYVNKETIQTIYIFHIILHAYHTAINLF